MTCDPKNAFADTANTPYFLRMVLKACAKRTGAAASVERRRRAVSASPKQGEACELAGVTRAADFAHTYAREHMQKT